MIVNINTVRRSFGRHTHTHDAHMVSPVVSHSTLWPKSEKKHVDIEVFAVDGIVCTCSKRPCCSPVVRTDMTTIAIVALEMNEILWKFSEIGREIHMLSSVGMPVRVYICGLICSGFDIRLPMFQCPAHT